MNQINKTLLVTTIILGSIIISTIIQSTIRQEQRISTVKNLQTLSKNQVIKNPQELLMALNQEVRQLQSIGKPILHINFSGAAAQTYDDFCDDMLETIANPYAGAQFWFDFFEVDDYSSQDLDNFATSLQQSSAHNFVAAGCEL